MKFDITTLNQLTELVMLTRRRYVMGLFEEKMKRARNIAADVEAAAMDDFDKVIARGEEVHKKRQQATTAHLVKLDSTYAALDSFEKSLDDYANGAPPLSDGAKSEPKAWEPPVKN